MPKSNDSLPGEFKDLNRLVAEWAIPTEAERYEKRLTSSMQELQSFYDVMLPRMDAIMAHLDGFPYGEFAEKEQRLLNLALMFMEVAPAIELFFQPDVPESFPWKRFRIERIEG